MSDLRATEPPDSQPVGLPGVAGGVIGAAALIAVITVVARIVGFGRIVVFARAIGPATCLGNAYFTANTVPNIVFEVVAGGALASLVVPVLAGPAARGDREESGRTMSALLTWTVVLLTPFAIIGIWLAHPVMSALVGDSGRCPSGQVVSTGTRMLLVFLPQVVLYGVGIVLAGTLQAHRRFAGPAIAPLLSSLVVIATYLSFAALFRGDANLLSTVTRRDELTLSLGTTAGVVALTLSLLVPLRRLPRAHRPALRPTLRFPAGVGARVRRLAVAGVVTLAAQEAAVAVVLRLANDQGSRGAVTLYNLAWTIFLLPWAVLAVPIATSAFPRLSVYADEKDDEAYAGTSAGATRILLLVMFLAAAVMIAASEPIARILAQHGPGATGGDVRELSRTIAAFAPGLVGYGLVAHLGRSLYARGRGRDAASSTVLGWLAVIASDLVLVGFVSRSETVPAVALGNSIGMTVAGCLLALAQQRTVNGALRRCGRAFVLGLVAAVVAAVLGHIAAQSTASGSVLGNVGSAALAAVVGLVAFGTLVTLVDRSAVTELRRRIPPDA